MKIHGMEVESISLHDAKTGELIHEFKEPPVSVSVEIKEKPGVIHSDILNHHFKRVTLTGNFTKKLK